MLRPVFSFSLLAGLVLVSSTCSGANPPLTAPDSLPVAFEPNVGQAPAEARYISHGRRYAVLLGQGSIELAPTLPAPGVERPGSGLRIRFLNSDATALPVGVDKLLGTANYFHRKGPEIMEDRYPDLRRCALGILILASTCFAAALMAIWITGLSWLPERTPTRFESRLMARPPELVQVETYRSTDKSAL